MGKSASQDEDVRLSSVGLNSSMTDLTKMAEIISEAMGSAVSKAVHRKKHQTLVPSWPKFDDSYRNFPKFNEDIRGYLADFCEDYTEKSCVLLMKEHCFSAVTNARISHLKTVDEILTRVSKIYNRPAKFIDVLLALIKSMNRLPEINYQKSEHFYSMVSGIFQEVRDLKLWRTFAHEQNIEVLVDKLSGAEVALWVEYLDQHSEAVPEAFEEFARQRREVAAAIMDARGRKPEQDDSGGEEQQEEVQAWATKGQKIPKMGKPCIWCEESGHKRFSCPEFKRMTAAQKVELVVRKRVCQKCLAHGEGDECWERSKEYLCTHPDCDQDHHRDLHVDSQE